MKMSERAEKALRASIKHWKLDVLKNGVYPYTPDCSLCKIYNNYQNGCRPCPIFRETGMTGCTGTAYNHYCNIHTSYKNTTAMKKHARAMIKFMEDLLP